MTKFDLVLLALHVLGVIMWIGGLFATIAFIDATLGEPEPEPRARLVKHLRAAAIVPDVGFAIALAFGLHWLFRFKLYEAHYMHPKLAAAAVLIGIHVWLRIKVVAIKRGEKVAAPPLALKPAILLLALAALIFVLAKIPS